MNFKTFCSNLALALFLIFLSACNTSSGTENESVAENEPNANIIYVSMETKENADGKSWSTAFNSIQKALDKATPNMEIWVAKGTYIPEKMVGGTAEREKSFQLKNDVALLGGFTGNETEKSQRDWTKNETILSGDLNGDDQGKDNRADNCFHVVTGNGTNNTAIIDGFTITKGNANAEEWPHDGGGGMNNDNGSPTIKNCLFTNNFGFADGGGMRNWGECKPIVINSTFKENEAAQEGGGMMNGPDSQTQIQSCTFINNTSGEDGGGMYNNETVNQIVINCLFYENTANLTGGGMYNVNGSAPHVINCTFIANKALEAGGSISNRDSNPLFSNCILWNNQAPKNEEVNNLRSEPSITYSNVAGGYNGDGNINMDPLFADQSFELTADSPCINKGNNGVIPNDIKTDLNTNERIVGDAIDLGAYEYNK